jgi:hypothetical protein
MGNVSGIRWRIADVVRPNDVTVEAEPEVTTPKKKQVNQLLQAGRHVMKMKFANSSRTGSSPNASAP